MLQSSRKHHIATYMYTTAISSSSSVFLYMYWTAISSTSRVAAKVTVAVVMILPYRT